jgi:hypothetical protein
MVLAAVAARRARETRLSPLFPRGVTMREVVKSIAILLVVGAGSVFWVALYVSCLMLVSGQLEIHLERGRHVTVQIVVNSSEAWP